MMKTKSLLTVGSKAFIGLSALSLASVALMSLFDPQSTMDLVGVQLNNNDALSSIRGIYGGLGIVLVVSLLYLMVKDQRRGLQFLMLFWGAYAASRVLTMVVDGPLGSFGTQWVLIESLFCVIAGALFFAQAPMMKEAV